MKRYRASTLAGILGTLAATGVLAQAFPAKSVRLIVPFPPGGATDTFSRVAAAEMSKSLGQQVIVENRPGAGTTIAAELVANCDRAPQCGIQQGVAKPESEGDLRRKRGRDADDGPRRAATVAGAGGQIVGGSGAGDGSQTSMTRAGSREGVRA